MSLLHEDHGARRGPLARSTIDHRRPDDYVLVRPRGALDVASVADLRAQLVAAIGAGSGRVLVDLSDVAFMDSSGLNVLVGALRAARAAGGDIHLCGPCSAVRRLIELGGLDRIFTIHHGAVPLQASECCGTADGVETDQADE